MSQLVREVQYAIRRLSRSPAFSVFSILTLAIGIGTTTAIYAVIRATLYAPIGIAEPSRVMNIYGGSSFARLSLPDYEDLRAQQTVFTEVLAWSRIRATWTTDTQTVVRFGEMVTGNYFSVLGVPTVRGRALEPADDRPGAPLVVVLSDDGWHRYFQGDGAIVGRTIRINDVAFEVVGVVGPGFRGVDIPSVMATPGWITFSAARQIGLTREAQSTDRDQQWVLARGRLKSGRSAEEAGAEMRAIGARLDAAYPRRSQGLPSAWGARTFSILPASDLLMHESVHPLARTFSSAVMIALFLVLLVACTSLANLALGRLTSRQVEIAIRLALGASRWRVFREMVVEALLLSTVGLAVGLAAAALLMRFMTTGIEVTAGVVIDVRPHFELSVWLMTGFCALLATLVAGLVPAWHITRAGWRSTVIGQTVQVSARWRGRRLIIGGQVAVSGVLLVLSSIFAHSAWTTLNRDLGINYEPLAAAQFDFSQMNPDPARTNERLVRLLDAVRKTPGVESAFIGTGLPIGFPLRNAWVARTVLPDSAWRDAASVVVLASTSDVIGTLGLTVLRGRAITNRDAEGDEHVAVVSAQVAQKVLGRPDAVGQVVQVRQFGSAAAGSTSEWQSTTIVGIIADVDVGAPGRRDRGMIIVPTRDHLDAQVVVAARMTSGRAESAGWLRDVVSRVDRGLPLVEVRTGSSLLNVETMFARVGSLLTSSMGGLALLLGLVGLSGVLGHTVASRTREIGIRMALGAERRRVLRMVIADGMRPVAAGLGCRRCPQDR